MYYKIDSKTGNRIYYCKDGSVIVYDKRKTFICADVDFYLNMTKIDSPYKTPVESIRFGRHIIYNHPNDEYKATMDLMTKYVISNYSKDLMYTPNLYIITGSIRRATDYRLPDGSIKYKPTKYKVPNYKFFSDDIMLTCKDIEDEWIANLPNYTRELNVNYNLKSNFKSLIWVF